MAQFQLILNPDLSVRKMDSGFFTHFPEFASEEETLHLSSIFIPTASASLYTDFDALSTGSVNELRLSGTLNSTANLCTCTMFVFLERNQSGLPSGFSCVFGVDCSHYEHTPPEILSSLFKHNPLPFYCFNTDGLFIHLNKKLVEFTGLPEEVLYTLGYKDFVHPEDLPQTEEYFQQALQGISNQYKLRVRIKDGVIRQIKVNKFPRIEDGTVTGVYGIFEDITEKHESEQRWQELVEQNPLPVLVFIDKQFVFTNSAAAKFYGFADPQDLIGKHLFDFVPEMEQERQLKREKILLTTGVIEPGESVIETNDGKTKYVITHARRITYRGQSAIQSVVFDITDLKQQKALIEKSLNEKETLLKEIHHRVKNNLAIISGLLELQIQNITNPSTIDVLRDSQNRILSMALVHQKLYQVETLNEIDLGVYVEELIISLRNTFKKEDNLTLSVKSEDVFVEIEQAIPCSLIINEVIVNAIKHAFHADDTGTIEVVITQAANQIRISISDNGIGLPKDFNPEVTSSLGSTLIKILTQQLEGQFTYAKASPNGTIFTLTFRLN